ncbi:hypothetical protein EUGRSUZ_H04398 [Eucalyptus grandis]|uniref:SMP domain-containing protein n=2 Tax=Eucalyptus grandis TaxID=71139 RepID=A0A059B6K4_EUCGR|nr:hypothetical protein EUGRSUZ_H04398 [Eucalyptus grandis]
MSQEQPRRRAQEPVKYGDVFASVEGELAGKPVAPNDAALMQTAENLMLGQVQKGAAASVMQSAATQNEDAGVVGHDSMNEIVAEQGVNVAAFRGGHVITESIGGQVLGQYSQRAPLVSGPVVPENKNKPSGDDDGIGGGPITIGEALEATALTIGDKPVERSDAAAIQAAEVRATGRTTIAPGGVAAAAQSAATLNARTTRPEEKTKMADVLWGASSKLPSDKPVTRADVEGVTVAEIRNDPFLTTHPAGVSATVAAAARLNFSNKDRNEKDKVPDI